MENVQHFIGADISKKTVDLACHSSKSHIRIENSIRGFVRIIKWLKQQKINLTDVIVIMEHTGLYSWHLESFLHQSGILYCKVSSLEIKRSGGLVRGKTDKIDACRIAIYGAEKREKLRPEATPSDALQRLKMLQCSRDQLVKQRAGLKNIVKEFQNIGLLEQDIILESQLNVIQVLNIEIKNLEEEMEQVIQQDKATAKNYQLLISIKSVGKVLAIATIVKTSNFTRFSNGRKFACYCGTAPFEHSSGTSVKGKPRVSHLADKDMKTLLYLAAMTAIQYNKELKAFYQRRLALGKTKMSTLNIIKNKIIHRMFAVINRQEVYSDDMLKAA
jgi:transposase